MNRNCAISALLLFGANALATQSHPVHGIVVEVDPAHRVMVVSCDAIPGYMDAMSMPFKVRHPERLKEIAPGMAVRFTMVHNGREEYAEHVQTVGATNYESEPIEAGRLTFLQRVVDSSSAEKIVGAGQLVPDFTLEDQAGKRASLSQFRGKVVALTFAYSRCPNPNYCFRLSNNLSILERRFRASAGKDLILMTIVIDPNQDRGKALERYADTWKADPAAWRFLTGSVPDVRAVAERFGMDFWSDEASLTHTFHTVVIDREGRLAANLEGNQFTAEQLGDIVERVMTRPLLSRSAVSPAKITPQTRQP